MRNQKGLIVRRTQRFDIALPSKVTVAESHAHIVHLSQAAGGRDRTVEMQAVDVASGGLGFISRIFVPRRTLLDVRIHGIGDRSKDVLIEAMVKVQRVVMTDRRPAYLIGTSIVDPTDEVLDKLEELLSLLGDEDAA